MPKSGRKSMHTEEKAGRWKKNLRKIPQQILSQVHNLETDSLVVGCLLQLQIQDIQNNIYRHIGLYWEGGEVYYEKSLVPLPTAGYYSRYNREGRELVLTDLPKEWRSWSIEAPNYGDNWKGSHLVHFTKEAFQREFVAPKLLPITTELVGETATDQALIFRFVVSEVLDRRSEDFEDQLLFNLNLLQENVGNCEVYPSDASIDEYLKTLYVNWELLPPGDKEETLTKILALNDDVTPETRKRITDRYEFLYSLKPAKFIAGTSEFRRYFGAQFASDLVVFENVDYGNAIYVMFDDWKQLSKKSRIELLSSKSTGFQRIPHTKTWKRRLRVLIKEELNKRENVSTSA
jgi:hypothetical protein